MVKLRSFLKVDSMSTRCSKINLNIHLEMIE